MFTLHILVFICHWCTQVDYKNTFLKHKCTLGKALPYLKMVGNLCAIDDVFDIFQSHWVPILCPTRSYCKRNQFLSISHLSPEIIGPNARGLGGGGTSQNFQ